MTTTDTPLPKGRLQYWVRCPVCNGNGLVDAGFYTRAGTQQTWVTSGTAPEECRTCVGRGMVQSVEVLPVEVRT